MRSLFILLLFGCTASLGGCGYHTAGSATHVPTSVHSVAVPFFQNKTQLYHSEVALTQAVVRELHTRTQYGILTGDTAPEADATLHGVLLTETIVPYTYNSRTGQSSSYLITITANVSLTDRDGRVLYQHQDYTFHQQYESTNDLASFIQEDAPAMQRLARDFAQSLVSDMLESF